MQEASKAATGRSWPTFRPTLSSELLIHNNVLACKNHLSQASLQAMGPPTSKVLIVWETIIARVKIAKATFLIVRRAEQRKAREEAAVSLIAKVQKKTPTQTK